MEYVYVAKNVVPCDLCEKIIEKFERDPNKCQGKLAYDTINYNLKKTIDLQYDYENDPEWKSIDGKLDMYLQTAFYEYTKYLYENVTPSLVISDIMHRENVRSGFQIQKYNIGDYFDWHIDDLKEKRRLMSYIIYLNTLKKEDGGYTEFFNSKKIQPIAGDILFFPATWTYPHRGAPLKDKVKYIATGFIQDE
jgi:Rps23 Pro-64 3,4-dihydroxylase Tpa1-like proline 4-hydroxylase|tara:strand:+ start:71 stop:649 length:579 start_codon:yes stop_codon:yes gene_type:complete